MKRTLGRLTLGFILAAGLVCAAEEPAAEHKGGVPEVSVLWKWANFAILFGVLAYLSSKQVGPLLKKRAEDITEGLAAGERAKADAEAKAREIEGRLSNLEGAVAKMKSEAAEIRDREAERIKRETKNEIERVQRQAEIEIESAGKLAALEVRHHGAKLALDLAERKVRERMNPELQSVLVSNFAKKVADGATRPSAS